MILNAKGLSEKQRQEIKNLEKACCEQQKLSMKLNWDMLDTRSNDENNDFLYYEGGELVGYLGLYAFGPKAKEVELTGMVHPKHRQQGIFTALFNEAKKECAARSAETMLIISERSSPSGLAFAKATGALYSFSEYRMKFNQASVPAFKSHGITLRRAIAEDLKGLRQLDALCFGKQDDPAEGQALPYGDPNRTEYVIELEGKFIGKIGVTMEGEAGYVFGFAMNPEHRGHGYGREALSLTLSRLLSEDTGTVLLEVAVQNDHALSLYKSCGFKEDTVYDYYEYRLVK